MSHLTRYVLAELLKVFAITLIGMTGLMVIVGVAQEAVRQGLGPEPILRLIPYATPDALRFAIPGTILFAACSVFGRMAGANEIVAVKSLGISPDKFILPALGLAFLISLLAVWLNDVAVSWGRRGMERVVLRSVEKIVYGVLRTQRSYSTKRFWINVREVDGQRLIRPLICFPSSREGKPPVELAAEEAQLRLHPREDILIIQLTNGQVTVGDQVTLSFPNSTIEREIPLTEAARKAARGGGPSGYPLWQMAPEAARQVQEIERLKQRYAIEAACQFATGDFPSLTSEDWAGRHQELRWKYETLHRLQTEPWRRWANGFSCLFFVMVGAPLAIRMRNSDLWSSFAVCFLPILIVYYPLLAYGVDRAKAGELPPCAVWLGNLILAVAGLWLMRRVRRY
jgi:lipopolysaccharide export system permease protein